jgi:hypothetical protein
MFEPALTTGAMAFSYCKTCNDDSKIYAVPQDSVFLQGGKQDTGPTSGRENAGEKSSS